MSDPDAAAQPVRVVTLGACLTLNEVVDLHRELVAVEASPLDIDASAVERVDTAGLQLLAATARRRRRAADQRLRWIGVSEPLLQGCRRLGLDGLMGLADTTPGKAP